MELLLDFVDVLAFDSGDFSSFCGFLLGLLGMLVLGFASVLDFFTFSIDTY